MFCCFVNVVVEFVVVGVEIDDFEVEFVGGDVGGCDGVGGIVEDEDVFVGEIG